MSNKLLNVFVLSLIIYGCKKNESNINSDTYSYKYSASSKIETTFDTVINEYTSQDCIYIDTTIFANSEVIAGDNNVFKYFYSYADAPDIADDEYSESILIEIPVLEDTFYYDSDGLNGLNTAFEYSCYCSNLGLIKADSGTISGIKIDDNNWKIKLNARFTGKQDWTDELFQKRFSISEIFKKE